MIPVHGVYEIAIPVRNLAQAEAFYTGTLGFTVGLRDEERNWVFLDTGGMTGMVVLQENTGEWPVLHFAFAATDKTDLDRAKVLLEDAGTTTQGPVHHEWMGADSLYFNDPDGHALEFIWVPKADPRRGFAASAFRMRSACGRKASGSSALCAAFRITVAVCSNPSWHKSSTSKAKRDASGNTAFTAGLRSARG